MAAGQFHAITELPEPVRNYHDRMEEMNQLTLDETRQALIAFLYCDPEAWDRHVVPMLNRRRWLDGS